VKELLKSVHNCQSYRKNNSGTFFYGPRCIFSVNRYFFRAAANSQKLKKYMFLFVKRKKWNSFRPSARSSKIRYNLLIGGMSLAKQV